MRRTIVILLSVVALIVVGVAIFLLTFDVDKYRPRIQTELQQKLERPVTLGHLGLRLFPLSIRIDGFTIGDSPAAQSGRPFATAKQVFVSAGLMSLISGSPEIKDLTLDRPEIELIRNQAGVWNFSTIGGNNQQSKSSNSQLSLDKLAINDGQIAVTDLKAQQARSVYDHIDLKLANFAPNKQFDVDVAAHLPGNGKQQLSFNGKAGPMNGTDTASVPVSGHFLLQEVSLAAINRISPGSLPENTDGIASGEGNVSSVAEKLSAKGTLKLDNTVIRGAKLDYPIESKFDLSADRKSDVYDINSGSLKLGQTAFDLSGTAAMAAKPGTINLHLKTDNSSIAELAKLAGAFGIAFDPHYQVKGSVTADINAKGPTSAPQLNGTILAKNIDVSGGEIKQPVSVPEIALTLTPATVTSNNFQAQSGATRLSGVFTLANYTAKNMNVDASLKTNGTVEIAELLNIAKAYGIDASKGMTAAGKVALDVHVHGPTAVPADLVYTGSADLSNCTLTSPTLTKPVSISSANVRFAQNSASIQNLVAGIGTTNLRGNMSARNFASPDVQFALTADKIDTTELEQLSKPEPASPSTPNRSASSRAGNQPSLLARTTGSGTLAAGVIKASDLTLQNVHATVKLDRGIIQMSPLTADLYGGKETGAVTLDTRPANSQCSLKTTLSGVDTNSLLSAATTLKNTLYGSLAANADLNFTLLSSNDLARTLNGVLKFNVTNGQLKNVNILNEISKVGKFLNSAPAQASGSSTALKKLSGTLDIRNGSATTNDLVAAMDTGSLSGVGALNLADQAINMHVSAVLGSGTSQQVGGNKVGGYLSTALANNKGELVVPVIVSGTMAHPVFAPDIQAMAKMKLSNLLPTTGDPGKLASGIAGSVLGNKGAGGIIGGILGKGTPQQGQPGAQQQQPDKDPIGSLLGQFGKKKKNQ